MPVPPGATTNVCPKATTTLPTGPLVFATGAGLRLAFGLTEGLGDGGGDGEGDSSGGGLDPPSSSSPGAAWFHCATDGAARAAVPAQPLSKRTTAASANQPR